LIIFLISASTLRDGTCSGDLGGPPISGLPWASPSAGTTLTSLGFPVSGILGFVLSFSISASDPSYDSSSEVSSISVGSSSSPSCTVGRGDGGKGNEFIFPANGAVGKGGAIPCQPAQVGTCNEAILNYEAVFEVCSFEFNISTKLKDAES
jgi:hypothetical protein